MQEEVRKETPHQAQIMDLQTNHDLTLLISSSKDCTAKVKRLREKNISILIINISICVVIRY